MAVHRQSIWARLVAASSVFLLAAGLACSSGDAPDERASGGKARAKQSVWRRLRLATTTSTDNSGLLDVLLPPFEEAHNVKVDVIAVGTGKALKLGENGDVDVVMVHARQAEDSFVANGFGVDRRDLMHNDFVIVGPEGDPAGLNNGTSAAEAFKLLAGAKADFVSRGDDSGTHKKEKTLWKAARVAPKGRWYAEVGQGMGAVLRMADERQAYTLTDLGTFLAYAGKIDLTIVFEGDKALANPYGVIAVNPKRHPEVNYELAKTLITYLTNPDGQRIIASFRRNGKQLFWPDAVPQEQLQKGGG